MDSKNKAHNSSTKIMQAAQIRICSINICGMSDRSQFTLDKYCHENSVDILAVQESSTADPRNLELKSREFVSDTTNSQNKGALLYVDSTKFSITKLHDISNISKNIDTAWGLVSGGGIRYIVGSVYIKLNYKNAIPDLIKMLHTARKLSVKFKAKKGNFCSW